MSKKKRPFIDHDEAQQKQYEREARLQYDPTMVNDSIKRWNDYSKSKQDDIKAEGERIYTNMAQAIENGKDSDSKEVREILARWHEHLRYFYEPTLDMLGGLGELYNSSPDFIANFQNIHPDLPAFLQEAIAQYVDDLETAELERMLAEDEVMNQRRDNLSL